MHTNIAPLRALADALTALPGYDGPDAWVPVAAIHAALWRLLYALDPDVGALAVEALHASVAAAYAIVGGYVTRHRGVGYYHEGDMARAVALLG